MTVHTSPYTRPAEGTKTGRVWEIADSIAANTGAKAKRSDVIEAYVAEGGNGNTASTQYHHWSQWWDPNAAKPEPMKPKSTTFDLRVDSNGRILVPAEIRVAMDLNPEGRAVARLIDGELRILSPKRALKRARELVRANVPSDRRLADELIAERRQQAAGDG